MCFCESGGKEQILEDLSPQKIGIYIDIDQLKLLEKHGIFHETIAHETIRQHQRQQEDALRRRFRTHTTTARCPVPRGYDVVHH